MWDYAHLGTSSNRNQVDVFAQKVVSTREALPGIDELSSALRNAVLERSEALRELKPAGVDLRTRDRGSAAGAVEPALQAVKILIQRPPFIGLTLLGRALRSN